MKIIPKLLNSAPSRRPAEHSPFQRFSFQYFSFTHRPLSPALRSNPTAVSGAFTQKRSPSRKINIPGFTAAGVLLSIPVLAGAEMPKANIPASTERMAVLKADRILDKNTLWMSDNTLGAGARTLRTSVGAFGVVCWSFHSADQLAESENRSMALLDSASGKVKWAIPGVPELASEKDKIDCAYSASEALVVGSHGYEKGVDSHGSEKYDGYFRVTFLDPQSGKEIKTITLSPRFGSENLDTEDRPVFTYKSNKLFIHNGAGIFEINPNLMEAKSITTIDNFKAKDKSSALANWVVLDNNVILYRLWNGVDSKCMRVDGSGNSKPSEVLKGHNVGALGLVGDKIVMSSTYAGKNLISCVDPKTLLVSWSSDLKNLSVDGVISGTSRICYENRVLFNHSKRKSMIFDLVSGKCLSDVPLGKSISCNNPAFSIPGAQDVAFDALTINNSPHLVIRDLTKMENSSAKEPVIDLGEWSGIGTKSDAECESVMKMGTGAIISFNHGKNFKTRLVAVLPKSAPAPALVNP